MSFDLPLDCECCGTEDECSRKMRHDVCGVPTRLCAGCFPLAVGERGRELAFQALAMLKLEQRRGGA